MGVGVGGAAILEIAFNKATEFNTSVHKGKLSSQRPSGRCFISSLIVLSLKWGASQPGGQSSTRFHLWSFSRWLMKRTCWCLVATPPEHSRREIFLQGCEHADSRRGPSLLRAPSPASQLFHRREPSSQAVDRSFPPTRILPPRLEDLGLSRC